MNWISVEEQLPEAKYGEAGKAAITSDDVLIFWPDQSITIGSYDIGGDWYDNEVGVSGIDPTHWMPLPEPPVIS